MNSNDRRNYVSASKLFIKSNVFVTFHGRNNFRHRPKITAVLFSYSSLVFGISVQRLTNLQSSFIMMNEYCQRPTINLNAYDFRLIAQTYLTLDLMGGSCGLSQNWQLTWTFILLLGLAKNTRFFSPKNEFIVEGKGIIHLKKKKNSQPRRTTKHKISIRIMHKTV